MTSEITPEQHGRDRTEIESPINSTTPTSSSPPATHPPEEDQPGLRQVVQRPWEPLLPNAGAKEREYLERLRKLWWDKSLDMQLREEADRYAKALQECLPTFEQMPIGNQRVTLPGCYYSRQPVTANNNKSLFNRAMKLLIEATAKQDCLKQWFAQYLLDGMRKR